MPREPAKPSVRQLIYLSDLEDKLGRVLSNPATKDQASRLIQEAVALLAQKQGPSREAP